VHNDKLHRTDYVSLAFIKAGNPRLSPAINRTWTDSWGHGGVITIYRIHANEMTGRTTDGVSSRALSEG
jgi:hypothetical protein